MHHCTTFGLFRTSRAKLISVAICKTEHRFQLRSARYKHDFLICQRYRFWGTQLACTQRQVDMPSKGFALIAQQLREFLSQLPEVLRLYSASR
jgi:hypothetical protein